MIPTPVKALLHRNGIHWNNDGTVGTKEDMGDGATITYSFMNDRLPGFSQEYYQGFTPLSATQKNQIRGALAHYEAVANINFQELSDGGTLRLGYAYTFFDFDGDGSFRPAGGLAQRPHYLSDGTGRGTAVVSRTMADFSPGTRGHKVWLHELGHAVAGLNDVTIGRNPEGKYANEQRHQGIDGHILNDSEDSQKYTVMSYNDHPDMPDVMPRTLGLYDIAAIQALYGANWNHNSDNTTYSWGTNETFIETIWDGGGVDTLDASQQTRRSVIDLRAGHFSSIGSYFDIRNAKDNVAIAYGVTIENANGGSGNDTIYGNEANNILNGNGGKDRLYGLGGNDTLYGGNGDDLLSGGDGDDLLVGGYDDDTFYGGDGNDTVSFDYNVNAKVTVNLSTGEAGFSALTSTTPPTSMSETLYDIENVIGGRYDDTITGNDESNKLEGRNGDDTIYGLDGNDELIGGNGDDKLIGGNGNDYLDGGLGDNTMRGGRGDDTYVFRDRGTIQEKANEGYDTIYSYQTLHLNEASIEELYLQGSNAINASGGSNDDLIYGNTATNVIRGNDGDDKLSGRSGDDTLYGDSDNDTLYGGNGSDRLYGGSDDDTLYGGNGGDTLYGGNNNDLLYGGNGGDTLNGGNGNDFISGNAGTDTLSGGNGNDYLVGSSTGDRDAEEYDELIGGAGADTFVLGDTYSGALYEGNGYAIIQDWNSLDDTIQLKGNSSQYTLRYGNWTGGSAQDTAIASSSNTDDFYGIIQDSTVTSFSSNLAFV